MSKKKYTGILAEPIYLDEMVDIDVLVGQPKSTSNINALRKRLNALYEHYGQEQSFDGSIDLIYDLAFAHVPGFEFRPTRTKAGRKTYWKMKNIAKLVSDVGEYLLRNPNHGELTACRNLLKKNSYGRIEKPNSLLTKHLEFKKLLFRKPGGEEKRFLVNIFEFNPDVVDLFHGKMKGQ